MVRNYLITAYRSLKNRPGITAINVLGLAVGLAACLLISLWVQHELSYDDFHPGTENIYRIALDAQSPGRSISTPTSPGPMAPTLARNFPEVDAVTQLTDQPETLVRVDGRTFTERRVYAADSAFFAVFGGFDLLRGNPETALTDADAVVLTRSTAARYFGRTDVLGETIQIDDATRRVTGVVADVPANAHFRFDLLTTLELTPAIAEAWTNNSQYTYAKLTAGHDRAAFAAKLKQLTEQYVGPQMAEALGVPMGQWMSRNTWRYFPQQLTEIHLHSNLQYELEPTGSMAYVWTFSIVALFILLIACINFTNLVTARATERASEVGVRKALGAQRRQLVGQFLGEALLTTAVAFGLTLVIASLALPAFNDVAGMQLTLAPLLTGPIGLAVVGAVGVVGLLAGGYPALVLSGFTPAAVLKGADRHRSSGSGAWLRQGLVVVQFTVSIALIAGTLVVWNQFDYIQSKRLGLDKERVVAIDRAQRFGAQQATFKEELRRLPGVVDVGAASGLFDDAVNNFLFIPEDRPAGEGVTLSTIGVDASFTDVMDIDVVTGRGFDPSRATDTSAVLINQAAAQLMGWDAPVGRTLRPGPEAPPLEVIGLVENFHFRSLRQRIDPLLLGLSRAAPRQVFVRLAPGETSETMAAVEATWDQFVPDTPMSPTFLDVRFAALHEDTQRTARLFAIFAGLAIAIACFGLFGLATYTARRRTKEIGIRKALGATALQIVRLLSVDFLKLVGVAFVVATPLAYWGMERWLQDFAYRTDLGVGLFLGAGALAFAIAVFTVGTQALRAARLDPATTLRDE